MDERQARDRVRLLAAEVIGAQADDLGDHDDLVAAHGADSLDVVELGLAVCDAFGVQDLTQPLAGPGPVTIAGVVGLIPLTFEPASPHGPALPFPEPAPEVEKSEKPMRPKRARRPGKGGGG